MDALLIISFWTLVGASFVVIDFKLNSPRASESTKNVLSLVVFAAFVLAAIVIGIGFAGGFIMSMWLDGQKPSDWIVWLALATGIGIPLLVIAISMRFKTEVRTWLQSAGRVRIIAVFGIVTILLSILFGLSIIY